MRTKQPFNSTDKSTTQLKSYLKYARTLMFETEMNYS